MRSTLVSRTILVALLGIPSFASAQDVAPPAATPPAATPPPAAAAPETPAAAPTPTAPAAPTAEAAPAPTPIPSYFRIDHDYMFGLQLWAGATYPITDKIGLATDIYIPEVYTPNIESAPVSWWSEFDIGPAFTLGPVTLTPMAGIAFDWAAKRAVALNVPQLYTVINLDKFYFESWVWTVLYSPFKDQVWNDYIHTRNWLLYKATKSISVGPQFELQYFLKDYKGSDGNVVNPKGVGGMPLGAHAELAFGTGNSLGIFVGYELDKDVRNTRDGNAAVGRLTFVHNF
jgi:hypothetical protein